MINLIILQITSLISNIISVVSIGLRLTDKEKKINENYISSLPLIKNDGWNLTVNVILILYTIVTIFVVFKLYSYHVEILIKNLTTYQDIKMSSLEIEENKLPHFFLTKNESLINFQSKIRFYFFIFKKKILFKIKKSFFVPYEFYKNETNENFDFLITAAAAVINNNQNNLANKYNSIPTSALSNEVIDARINKNIRNKILSDTFGERIIEDNNEKNLNVNFPCNQIKELINNNYNFITNSHSNSNSENNTRYNNRLSFHGNINTRSLSISRANSEGRAMMNNEYNRNSNNNEIIINNNDYNTGTMNNNNNLLYKKIPKNNYTSKNMQKRMNQYLLNHNILNLENIFLDQNSIHKDRNLQSVNSLNRQTFSSYYSSNINENNINLGEIHLSEREKNAFNHVLREMNIINTNNQIIDPNKENPIKDYFKMIGGETVFTDKINNKSFQEVYRLSKENLQLNKEDNKIKHNYNDSDKVKRIPRQFRINSNIDYLNQKHGRENSKQTIETNQSNAYYENNIDSHRKILLNHIDNNDENLNSGISPKANQRKFYQNQVNKISVLFENDSKKSLNEKIISIINSSGTVDDVDLSEMGNYNY